VYSVSLAAANAGFGRSLRVESLIKSYAASDGNQQS
jgi:hypothetical protein